jgi:hypothetical protein
MTALILWKIRPYIFPGACSIYDWKLIQRALPVLFLLIAYKKE